MSLPGFHSLPLPLVQLSLAAVLKCGQSFRWAVFDPPAAHLLPEYRLCLKDRVVCLRQSPDTLYYRTVFPESTRLQLPPDLLAQKEKETLEWLEDYFQLKTDLVYLYKQWAEKDNVFATFQERFVGIRMLRQDPWENLISFICSANNNISRITKMVQNLCKTYSQPLLSLPDPFDSSIVQTYHPFPSPTSLASPGVSAKLRELGFGYRAKYIHETAKVLSDTHGNPSRRPSPSLPGRGWDSSEGPEAWLKSLRNSSTQEAREELLKFMGVGRKVADCVLLMSLDKTEVVPVDTHVQQIATKHYGLRVAGASGNKKVAMTPKLYEMVNTKFYDIWGEYAGWAHSVLFTADLKSFSSYGLTEPSTPSPAPSPSPLPASTPAPQSSTAAKAATTKSTKKKPTKTRSIHIPINIPPEEIPTAMEAPTPGTRSSSRLKRQKSVSTEPDIQPEVDGDGDVKMMGISQLCIEANAALVLHDRDDEPEQPSRKKRRR